MQRGILGGTFDPPHFAHLVAGEAAYRDLGLDVVEYLPAGSPWQKADRGITAARHRLEMTRLAVGDVEYFVVDDREVRREGWTYTIDTLAELPDDDEVTLILGSDAASRLPTWHRADEVMRRCTIAVLARPGAGSEAVPAAVTGRVHWLDAPMMDLSGTMLRERARRGSSLRFLVPDPVWDYVRAHGLYTH